MKTSIGIRRGLAALALAIAGVTGVAAQGSFYREVAKDGRIYVFNNMTQFADWEKSGEMGAGITLLGYGPAGETMVFDSEQAIHLYNFKHDRPGDPRPQPTPKPPSPYPSGKITGLAFGDFYWFADHHDPKFDGQQGFWLRRAYLGYDHAFNPTMSMRFRLEMNSDGALAGGNLVPYVKDAYFNWKFHGRQQARLGIQPSLTFDSEEGFWGLRHIEKTPADLYGIDSSRDFGLAFSGPIGEQGVSYAAQFGNDSGNGSESDEFKVVRFLGLFEARSGLRLEGVFNHGKRPNGQDRTTAKGLLGFKKNAFRVAGQFLWQERQAGAAETPDTRIHIWSGFGVWDVMPNKASLFGRVDSVNGDRGGTDIGLPGADRIAFLALSDAAPFKLFIAGLEFHLDRSIRLSPNVEWVKYDDPATGPSNGDDVIPRLTFYWTW